MQVARATVDHYPPPSRKSFRSCIPHMHPLPQHQPPPIAMLLEHHGCHFSRRHANSFPPEMLDNRRQFKLHIRNYQKTSVHTERGMPRLMKVAFQAVGVAVRAAVRPRKTVTWTIIHLAAQLILFRHRVCFQLALYMFACTLYMYP